MIHDYVMPIISFPQTVCSLLEGKVVAVPTETVYGLAASIHRPEGIAKIFSLKNRPLNNPLILHLHLSHDLDQWVTHMPPDTNKLMQAFWPGPLTLVLPAHPSIPSIARAHLPTIALRTPDHPLLQKVLQKTGPLVAPSANLSTYPSSTSIMDIERDFGSTLPILDGGICQGGLESTILSFHEGVWHIVRLGILPAEELQKVLGYAPRYMLKTTTPSSPNSPGQLLRHYAPRARLFLSTRYPSLEKIDAASILGFSERSYPKDKRLLCLGSLKSPEAVASRLYRQLRSLDEEHIASAWVDMHLPEGGLWATIKERLEKAAN